MRQRRLTFGDTAGAERLAKLKEWTSYSGLHRGIPALVNDVVKHRALAMEIWSDYLTVLQKAQQRHPDATGGAPQLMTEEQDEVMKWVKRSLQKAKKSFKGGPISRLVTELLAEIKADPNFINDLLAELFPGHITPSNAIGDSGVVKMGDAAASSTGSSVQGASGDGGGSGVQGSFSFSVSVTGADGGPPPPEFAALVRRILEAIGDAFNDDDDEPVALPGGVGAINGSTAKKSGSGKTKSPSKKKKKSSASSSPSSTSSKPKSDAKAAEL
ncbi:hypothetical protein HYH02_008465 [Chlamydomonas schloesseri]|uniref:Uncharacterized protein n=1 Tax=Chlamydomonas schloesseri TaxID=2026947 RepID=A0A835WFB4_9CHLO|nr:hypothetical protein HYH02_008465 [Chlamydomonas schloesseri]|eukprot:KAG2446474.1 hypothetical protein HYH02_008465 [Chlamydomonas schloesseri]